jgi:hypothetical protein
MPFTGELLNEKRDEMFKAIQAEMTRRSAARRTAQATARTAIGKRA